ncbi:hypothetical protein H8D85_01780 [bacterium]|nr:hypothetical protein [bacterium]
MPSNQYSLLLRVNSNIPLNSEVGTEPSVTLSGIINSSFVSVGTLAATEEDNTIWTGSIDFTGTPTGTYQVGLTSANSLSNKISTSSNEDGTYHFQTIDNISIGYPSGAFHGTPYTQTAVTTGDDLSIEVIIPNISDLYDNYTLSTNTSDLHDSLSNISNVGNVISGTIGITTNEYIGENNTSITYTNNNTGYSVFKLTPNFIIDHTSPNISLTQLNYDLTDDALHVDTADGNLNYNTTISNISDIDELVFYESLIIGRLSINNPSVYEDPKVISSGVTDPSEINIPTVVATTFSSSAPNANGGVFINADTWTTDTNIISLKVRILDNNGSL